MTTAHATTGPASGPLPTSSTPARALQICIVAVEVQVRQHTEHLGSLTTDTLKSASPQACFKSPCWFTVNGLCVCDGECSAVCFKGWSAGQSSLGLRNAA